MIWFILIYFGSVMLGTLALAYWFWKYDKIIISKDS